MGSCMRWTMFSFILWWPWFPIWHSAEEWNMPMRFSIRNGCLQLCVSQCCPAGCSTRVCIAAGVLKSCILPVRAIRLTKPYRGFFRLLRLLCSSLLSVQCCVHSLEKSTLQISVPIYLWDCLKKWEKGCPVLYCMYSLHIFSGFLEYMVPIRCRWSQSSFWSPVF